MKRTYNTLCKKFLQNLNKHNERLGIEQTCSGIKIEFENCVGQSYDNEANMAGKYNSVQAVLLRENSNCTFSVCENHALNLVGVDSAKSCKARSNNFFWLFRLGLVGSSLEMLTPTRVEDAALRGVKNP
ncbi:hypothetical protein ILUMI_08815 [Ignelater luminosus]|uniref:Uncharacterized protein n=1 Tax=Ignelater luminosus TaxID=2038154 RepID=A0A8K0GF35_IGNLU|nr:hypothetical protein ILUMI_08815 [Ignelater luminosus]